MKKKREFKGSIVTILALVLAIILEVVTTGIINYNVYTRILSFVVYFNLNLFAIKQAKYNNKKSNSEIKN